MLLDAHPETDNRGIRSLYGHLEVPIMHVSVGNVALDILAHAKQVALQIWSVFFVLKCLNFADKNGDFYAARLRVMEAFYHDLLDGRPELEPGEHR